MNFSALNTHAIGVQLVTASAVVEGAGSFSAEANASAQVNLYSYATAVSITSIAIATTQSVTKFATATATMGCNAAANTDGYRVQFSNAEIVCTASSNANAVVHRQAVVYVTAQATNVAVGSRVAYASASLQAECNLTANSGKVIFASAITGTNGYWTSGTPAVYGWSHYQNLYVVRSNQSNSVYDIAPGQNYYYSYYPRDNSSVYRTVYPAIAHSYNSTTYYRYELQNYGIVTAAIAPVFIETAWQPTASLIATAYVTTNFYGIAAVSANSIIDSTSYVQRYVTSVITASSESVTNPHRIVNATPTPFFGSSLAISVGNKKAVGNTVFNAVASLNSLAAVNNLNTANFAAISEVSSFGINTASTTVAIQANADFNVNLNRVVYPLAINIIASAECASTAINTIDASGFFTGSNLTISVGDKIAIAHTTLLATAAMSSSANAYRNTAANAAGSCLILASVSGETAVTGNVTALSNVTTTPHLIANALGNFTGSNVTISVGEKQAVTQTNITANAEINASSFVTSNVRSSANEPGTQLFVFTSSYGNYYVNGVANASLDLKYGFTYTFDTSDSSLAPHPGLLSEISDGSHNGGSVYTAGGNNFSVNGTYGTAGSSTNLFIFNTISTNLYYYCPYHSGMGGSITSTQGNVGIAGLAANSGTISFNTAVISGAAAVASVLVNKVNSNAQFTGSASATIESVLLKSCTSNITALASITATAEVESALNVVINGSSNLQSTARTTRFINSSIVQASSELSIQVTVRGNTSVDFAATCLATGESSVFKEVEAHISGNAVHISIGNKIAGVTANSTIANANLTALAQLTNNGQAVVTCSALISGLAGAETAIFAEAHVSDTFDITPGYWIPDYTVAGYNTYTYTTSTSVYGYYSPVPSFQSRTNPGGVTYYYSGSYYFYHGMYPAGSDYTWTFTPQNQNSSPPTESSTWGSFGPAPAANTSGRYKGASIGTTSHQDSVYIPGLNQVTVYHYAATYQILEDTVTTHTTTYPAVYHPAVWVEAIYTPTGYGPNAQVSTAYVIAHPGSQLHVIASANVLTIPQLLLPVSATVFANAELATASVIQESIYAEAEIISNSEVIASCAKILLAVLNPVSSNASVNTNVSVIRYNSANISCTSNIATLVGAETPVYAIADVSEAGYTEPSYDTFVDTLAAAYWDRADGQQTVITSTWESISPYGEATYNGNNYIGTIRNTLNAGAPAGTSYITPLSSVAYRNGIRGYNGAIKRRVTTTHPAVFVVTATSPLANVVATADVYHSVSLNAAANLEGSIYLESTSALNIEANTTITATNYVDVYVNGAFTGSNVNITASDILIFASGAVEASATIATELYRERFSTALIEGNAEFTSQGVGLNVSEARATASATIAAEGTVLRFVAVPLNVNATVIITTRFVLLAQEGQRSNGILILVEAENRSLEIVVKKERVIYAKAA